MNGRILYVLHDLLFIFILKHEKNISFFYLNNLSFLC